MTTQVHDNLSRHEAVLQLLDGSGLNPASPYPLEVQQAVLLARRLQKRAAELQTPAERRQQAELDRMIHNPGDKATLMQMTDQAFRAQRARRAADQLIHILDVQGVPRFFGTVERTLLKGFQSFGAYLPGVAVPAVKEKMHQETANVVLPAEPELLGEHLRARWEEGLRMNVNHLGEALLGERDAQQRLQGYLQMLQRPEIEVISVKISTIYSQISALAREHTVGVLADRMELLYRAAARERFERPDRMVVPKFVYLDMEEYRDKDLTAEVFMRALDRPGLEHVRAGIALQAYIPDSFRTQRQINEWARRRVADGGAPVTIRLVKGANMEMERVEASLRGWPLATFGTKRETDANYIRMLQEGMHPENLAAVRLGVASHNLFTLAYGLVLAARAGAMDKVQFEMLEGMANHQRRALFELVGSMLLYAPACRQEEFVNAIGYLVRRLDENTGPDNFLRHAFNVKVGSDTWNRLETQFLESFSALQIVGDGPRRTQNRNEPYHSQLQPGSEFRNEPDTDWSLPHNGQWAESIMNSWRPRCGQQAVEVPLVLADGERFDDRQVRDSLDPSRPGVVVARYRQANEADVDLAVSQARDDCSEWRRRSAMERAQTLYQAAAELGRQRGNLLGAMLAEGGKTLPEADPEVSEAMDFCRFYADSAVYFADELSWLKAIGKGVVVVVSPWNFPLAIPCGGVAAALAAGNTVILKPASDTVLVAYLLCKCLWDAGVPHAALQFLPGSGRTVGERLVTHGDVDAVVLTGGTATARQMLAAKPTLHLLAETGGKNATIVTALSDRDQAIKNVLHSAFSHSGQKCSATSLLLLEDEVYYDESFREAFVDAVESQQVGSAWELSTKLGPLIRPPSGDLERALKELEPGEEWAVMPRLHVNDNPNLVSPGVKWGVQPDGYTHTTEFFGPLLAVMRFRDLHEAIDIVNATGYGLTSGLESLDDREHEIWQAGIRAGNLYINRPTTGAIVLRQPFGGMGKSAVGPGVKAGGPNYVVPLMTLADERADRKPARFVSQNTLDENASSALDGLVQRLQKAEDLEPGERNYILEAIESYRFWAAKEFRFAHDHFRLTGEDNFRRYLPVKALRIRVHSDDTFFDIFARAAAARAAGCLTTVSVPSELAPAATKAVQRLDRWTDPWAGSIEFVEESDEQLAEALRTGHTERVRFAAPERVPLAIRQAAADALQYVADAPVLAHGRVELLWYVREQSLSHMYHRYGNLGRRAEEVRARLL